MEWIERKGDRPTMWTNTKKTKKILKNKRKRKREWERLRVCVCLCVDLRCYCMRENEIIEEEEAAMAKITIKREGVFICDTS